MSRLDDPDAVNMRLLSEPDAENDDWDLPSAHASTRLQKTNYVPLIGRSRSFRVLCVLIVFTAFGLLISVSREPIVHNIKKWRDSVASALKDNTQTPGHSDHSLYVAGPPSPRFRDNLVNGTKYITAWPIGGFTNQVMGQINLLYLSLLALRIPIIADFVPGHMHGNPGWLPVSKVFDLPRLADSLNTPVLEWSEFKNRTSHETEYLGCWSVHTTIFHDGGHYASEVEFGLDISLTPVPDSRFRGDTENMQDIMALASLGWPEARAAALRGATTLPSPANQRVVLPDEDMLCFDELYYANSVKAYEWEEDWVPMWTQAGKYLRWEPDMENLARSYIKRAFRLDDSDPFPAYISMHIRHTDFASLCHNNNDTESCFPSLSAYGEKVDEVRTELLETRGVHVDSVFVASDEEDPTWWALVEQRGWHRIDWVAEGTEAKYSEWYPIVLDSVALSLGKGFVGTTRSTLSLLAAKRVQDWEGGPVRKLTLNY